MQICDVLKVLVIAHSAYLGCQRFVLCYYVTCQRFYIMYLGANAIVWG